MVGAVELFTDGLSSHDISRVTGASYRQVDYWCRTGVVRPLVDADGPGSRRLFHRDQVRVVLAVLFMRQSGVGLPYDASLRGASRNGNSLDRDLARLLASMDGPWEGQTVEISRTGPLTVTLDLGWIEAEAERRMASEKERRQSVIDAREERWAAFQSEREHRIRALVRGGR